MADRPRADPAAANELLAAAGRGKVAAVQALLDGGLDLRAAEARDGPAGFIATDAVRLTAFTADLDLDSDNDNAFGNPDRSPREEHLEDWANDARRPGKLIVVNDDDGDADGIPDFADGLRIYSEVEEDWVPIFENQPASGTPPSQAQGERFVPIRLEIPEPLDVDHVRLRIVYDGPATGAVAQDGAGTPANPYTYELPQGRLRLWTQEGHEPRNAPSLRADPRGHYVAPNAAGNAADFYTPADLAALGLSNSNRTVTLWAEGIAPSAAPGDIRRRIQIDPDGAGPAGFQLMDAARLTARQLAFVRDGADDRDIDATDPLAEFLRIGHWGADVEFPPGSAGGVGFGVDGYRPDGTLRNDVGTAINGWDNFIDRDPDRFYVRLVDVASNLDAEEIETIDITIGTRLENGDAHDNQTTIRLTETGVNTGLFVSESQLLTAPDLLGVAAADQDDGFAVVSAITGLPVDDDDPHDRTHQATIDGVVRIEWGAVARQVPVSQRAPDERRVLNVQVYIFNEPFIDENDNDEYDEGEEFIDISAGADAFGLAGEWGPIWTQEQVDVQMSFLRAYLASASIRVNELPRQHLTPVGDLFVQPGAGAIPGTLGFFDDFPDDVTTDTPSRDEEIIQANFRSAVNLNGQTDDDVIDIYFVAPFTLAAALGSQYRPGFLADNHLDPLLANQVHIGFNSVTLNIPFVVAHEVMHQLTDRGDVATPDHIFFPTHEAQADDGTTVLHKRRMTALTELDARTRNTLLRDP